MVGSAARVKARTMVHDGLTSCDDLWPFADVRICADEFCTSLLSSDYDIDSTRAELLLLLKQ